MKKPEQKTRKYYDYHECEEYIAHKLGVKDLRDFDGKYDPKTKVKNPKYKDFWHLICDTNDINNPCSIYVPEPKGLKDWQIKICQAFHEEFGADTEYWVEW